MSLFNGGKACFFSDLHIQLFKNGKPYANQTVTRSWGHSGKDETDSAVTDSEGKANFPSIYRRSFSASMPLSEFVVGQGLYIDLDGEELQIWSNGKNSTELNSELGGKKLDLKCEITDELQVHREFGSLLATNCKW